MKNKIFIVLSLYLFICCKSHTPYYHNTKQELKDYYQILPAVTTALEADDDQRLYSDTDNVLIREFMAEHNLEKIILKGHPDVYERAIVFQKYYIPFFQNVKSVEYEYGRSPLRDRINNGIKYEKGTASKILDSMFIYRVDKKPAFGQ